MSKRLGLLYQGFLLSHNNAKPHTSHANWEFSHILRIVLVCPPADFQFQASTNFQGEHFYPHEHDNIITQKNCIVYIFRQPMRWFYQYYKRLKKKRKKKIFRGNVRYMSVWICTTSFNSIYIFFFKERKETLFFKISLYCCMEICSSLFFLNKLEVPFLQIEFVKLNMKNNKKNKVNFQQPI